MLCNGEFLAWLLGEITLLLLDESNEGTDQRRVELRPSPSSLQSADGARHSLPICLRGRQIHDLYLACVQDSQESLDHFRIELGSLPILQFLNGLLQAQ